MKLVINWVSDNLCSPVLIAKISRLCSSEVTPYALKKGLVLRWLQKQDDEEDKFCGADRTSWLIDWLTDWCLQVAFYLNNYTSTADLLEAVNNISYGGYPPNLGAALAAVRSIFAASNGARLDPSVLKLAVVFSTATPSTYRSSTLAEARAVARMGIGVVTVSVGTFSDRQLLKSISSYPSSKNLFALPSVRNVSDLVDTIKRIICRGASESHSSASFEVGSSFLALFHRACGAGI